MEYDPAACFAYLAGIVDEYVKQAARDTMKLNAAAHPACRWARIPDAGACEFCIMLGSRGFVYASEESAGADDPYHPHCNCQVEVCFNPDMEYYELNGTVVSRGRAGNGAPGRYGPDELYERYLNAGRKFEGPGPYVDYSTDALNYTGARTEELRPARMYSRGDPAREYFGSAEVENLARFEEINRIYKENGVEIVMHSEENEAIAYEPSLTSGAPGRLHRTAGMSLSAEEHEYSHFEYDKRNGYPGLSYYLQHPEIWDKMESTAYEIEIARADAVGNDALAGRLVKQMNDDFARRGRPVDE